MTFRKHAFTLMELLVVVSIIAVLLALLLPSLKDARKAGQTVQCLSNLRQMGAGTSSYVIDHRLVLPVVYERRWHDSLIDSPETGGRGYTWAGIIQQDNRIPFEVFICPGDQREPEPKKEMFWQGATPAEVPKLLDEWTFSYTGNGVYYPSSSWHMPWSLPYGSSRIPDSMEGPYRLADIPNPSAMYNVWDGYISFFSTPSIFDGQAVVNQSLNGGPNIVYHGELFRHARGRLRADMQEGPNVLAVDGHAMVNSDFFNWMPENVATRVN